MDEEHGAAAGASGHRSGRMYQLPAEQSGSSIFEGVEMAQEEVFSGPMAESLPSSVSAFSHRRARRRDRADSIASFTYYNEPGGLAHGEGRGDEDERYGEDGRASDFAVSVADEEELDRRRLLDEGDGVIDFVGDGGLGGGDMAEDEDLDERGVGGYAMHRRPSTQSVRARLLGRRDSTMTEGTASNFAPGGGRCVQKLHMANEDLTIAIAGFRTSRAGMAAYVVLCVATLGVAYLLLRWLPRWYVRLVGRVAPLRDCEWVVVENEWGELALLDVDRRPYGRPLSTVFGIADKLGVYGTGEDPDPILVHLIMINYRCTRFYFHPDRDKFVLCAGWKDPSWIDVYAIRSGIDADEKSHREAAFGRNLVDIEEPPIMKLLVDEVLHPFYIFQIASLTLWSLDEYYYYAIAIFLMSVGSITATLIETRLTMRRLREISRFECDVRALRNGFWRFVVSSDLVPGDVYEVSDPNLTQFPADSLLLSGDCIVNESMLTGESVPVSKSPVTNASLSALDLSASTLSPDSARHFLYAGTKVVRARRPHDDGSEEAVALAMVVRTGFNTTKGALVRSMLFPKPSGFKFYRDSFRYITVMAGVAVVAFIVTFVNFIRLGLSWHLIIVRALDLITIVVPPALPATLTIGINFAISRLKKRQIFCISPQRVNVGGKLDIMCFDKTGTLTEEGLDVLGVRVVSPERRTFEDLVTTADALVSDPNTAPHAKDAERTHRAVLYTMATCHSLREVNDELVGDPLDLKMFEFTGWSFEEGKHTAADADDAEQGGITPSVARPPADKKYGLDQNGFIRDEERPLELGLLRSFEFVSNLRRASVIVRAFGSQSGDVFVKGAPECMRDICRADSFPSDYDDLLAYYTHKGYRVIACATRHIGKLSWLKAQKLKRAEVETNLEFIGFIIFENKLKPTTTGVISELLRSNISAVMVTGDNLLTAISVARECNLMSKTAHCYVPHFVDDARGQAGRLQWECIDNPALKLDDETLQPLRPSAEQDVSSPYEMMNYRDYSLAISGDVFRWVVDYAPVEVMNRMLVCGKVFARMSPDEKHELVKKLQSIDYCVGFCGDGANDCGALKAADVGISLSEAEASVAAPFTSRIFDISCVPSIIREGRAALVTSFSCFKYMSLYSAIQFTSVSFLYASASNLGDFQFLFIDLTLILPIAVFMGWAGPFPILSTKKPTANLVSRKVFIPLIGQICICICIQAVAWHIVRLQDWYIPPKLDIEKSNIKNSENTALFLSSCFEYILSGVVLNAGPPFRQSAAHNWPFVATVAVSLVICCYFVLGPADWLRKLMQLTWISWSFKFTLLLLGLLYIVIAWVFEKRISQALVKAFAQVRKRLSSRPKKRKAYKIILEKMRI